MTNTFRNLMVMFRKNGGLEFIALTKRKAWPSDE